MYKVPDTRMDWFEYESIQKSLQYKHVNMLRNNISENESVCKWIKPGEQIEIYSLDVKYEKKLKNKTKERNHKIIIFGL